MIDITELLIFASNENASDVHVTVGVSPKIRVNGKLKETNFPKISATDTLEMFLSIVNPAQRDRFESKGEIDLSISISGAGRFRVNVYKQRGSISLSFRLVGMQIPEPDFIMVPQVVLDICKKKKGLVIISGPAGSGKSTLMATMVDHINDSREANIITIEDPIEYLHSHKKSIVNQREVGLDTESYEEGLKAALKADADIIEISAVEDERVAAQILMAAQTGKLIFTSMYTAGVVETIEAFCSLFSESQQEMARMQLSSCLRAVVTRQLCEGANGTGRVPAYGVMLANKKIKSIIRSGNISEILEVMSEKDNGGMITMDDSLVQLCQCGNIDADTALNLANDQEYVAERLSL